MTPNEIVGRARSAVGRKTKYVLGGGKMTPVGEHPMDERGGCDCSAFVCWVLGINKHQEGLAWLRRVNGGWYNTNGIWWDAVKERTGIFDCVPASGPIPGDVIVYPGRIFGETGPAIGHVGIVSATQRPMTPPRDWVQVVKTVIHCSGGNFRKFGDAVAETGPEVFLAVKSTRVVRAACMEIK